MIKRFLTMAVVAIISLSGFCATSEYANPNAIAAPQKKAIAKELVTLTDDNAYRPGTRPAYPTVLDFNATWCGPCRRLNPAIHDAAKAYSGKVEIVSIDIDANPATARAFNVQSIPTVIFMMPDGSITTHVGLGDFMAGMPANGNVSVAEGEKIIKDNLFKMIDAMLKTKPKASK